jgi:hypothetical protein
LDRWFVSLEWEELHPSATLTALSSSLSDHCLIFMSTAVEPQVGKRFRFERFWLSLPGFDDEIKALWDGRRLDGLQVPSNPLARLDFKLRLVSRGLQRWSQRRVGSVRDSILVANEVILRLDLAQESRALSDQEIWLRRSLKLKLLGLASLERTIARQRARVAGIRDGDASTQFYRILAASRSRRCLIGSLSSGDRTATDLRGKVDLATSFYLDLLGTAQPREADVSLWALGLEPVDLADLEAPFSEQEVWDAVRELASGGTTVLLTTQHLEEAEHRADKVGKPE